MILLKKEFKGTNNDREVVKCDKRQKINKYKKIYTLRVNVLAEGSN